MKSKASSRTGLHPPHRERKATSSSQLLRAWHLTRLITRMCVSSFTLRRKRGRLHVVFTADKARAQAAAVGPSAAPEIAGPNLTPDQQMRQELTKLLSQHPKSRATMRHLACVEQTLRRSGAEALDTLPVPVLSAAADQLERVVVDWSLPGLALLRSRLAMAVLTQERRDVFHHGESQLSDFHTPQRLQVSEVSRFEL